jgi:hypoxanthine phosphoribosyltransferase
VRAISGDVRCEFLGLNQYEEPVRESGEVKIILDIEDPLEGCDLLIVEDLVDTGITLRFLKQALSARRPASIKCCTLLWKKGGVEASLVPEYVGFEVERSFFVGYGIDHEGRYREVPYIGTLERPR